MGRIRYLPCFLLKPHGSIDVVTDPRAISMPIPPYPQDCLVIDVNNTQLIRIPRKELGAPRLAAYIVLPNEYSPYRDFQWVRPGYNKFRRIAKSITHCVFLGLSYSKSDREELDFILKALPCNTEICEANPDPPSEFRSRVESYDLSYVPWKEGKPQPIPSTSI